MIIGTVRTEEAEALNARAGYHAFTNEDGTDYGSFEVFWFASDSQLAKLVTEWNAEIGEREVLPSGWYWWSCYSGCLPDGDAIGPFASSIDAYYDAID